MNDLKDCDEDLCFITDTKEGLIGVGVFLRGAQNSVTFTEKGMNLGKSKSRIFHQRNSSLRNGSVQSSFALNVRYFECRCGQQMEVKIG